MLYSLSSVLLSSVEFIVFSTFKVCYLYIFGFVMWFKQIWGAYRLHIQTHTITHCFLNKWSFLYFCCRHLTLPWCKPFYSVHLKYDDPILKRWLQINTNGISIPQYYYFATYSIIMRIAWGKKYRFWSPYGFIMQMPNVINKADGYLLETQLGKGAQNRWIMACGKLGYSVV